MFPAGYCTRRARPVLSLTAKNTKNPLIKGLSLSGWKDLNTRPPAPKATRSRSVDQGKRVNRLVGVLQDCPAAPRKCPGFPVAPRTFIACRTADRSSDGNLTSAVLGGLEALATSSGKLFDWNEVEIESETSWGHDGQCSGFSVESGAAHAKD